MSEFGVRPPKALAEAVRDSENEREEAWREHYLSERLFHPEHTEQTWNRHPDSIALLTLENEFLFEKKYKNMGERFDLALKDKYLGKIHTVELGSTTNPSADGAVDGLKEEYLDLLDWLKKHGIVEDELSRQESGRTVNARRPVDPEVAKKMVILERDRPLVRTDLVHDGNELNMDITKRMVFALPLQTVILLLNRFKEKLVDENSKPIPLTEQSAIKLLNDSEVLDFIESTFLHHGTGGVVPIRTSYYLTTDIKNTPQETTTTNEV